MCLTLLDAFLQSHFIYRSRCLGSKFRINCNFIFFSKILEDQKSTRPKPPLDSWRTIFTGLVELQSCFLRWEKSSPMDSGTSVLGQPVEGAMPNPPDFQVNFICEVRKSLLVGSPIGRVQSGLCQTDQYLTPEQTALLTPPSAIKSQPYF